MECYVSRCAPLVAIRSISQEKLEGTTIHVFARPARDL